MDHSQGKLLLIYSWLVSFPEPWTNLKPFMGLHSCFGLELIQLFVKLDEVDFSTVSAASGNSFLNFSDVSGRQTELEKNNSVEFVFIRYSLLIQGWYVRSLGITSILKYISAMSHINATGFLRKRSRTSVNSLCSFGPW